jgi:hypothetical protein
MVWLKFERDGGGGKALMVQVIKEAKTQRRAQNKVPNLEI